MYGKLYKSRVLPTDWGSIKFRSRVLPNYILVYENCLQSYDKYMKTFERLEGEGALIYFSWMDIPFGESKGLTGNVKFLFNSIFFTFNFPLSL